MKKLILLALASTLTLATQNVKAAGMTLCQKKAVMGLLLVTTGVSAPTGTALIFSATTETHCRDEVLNLKEDAMNYQLTGQMSALLAESIEMAQAEDAELSSQEIVDRILALDNQE